MLYRLPKGNSSKTVIDSVKRPLSQITDKNSSGDEIANVNFFYDDIAHVFQNNKNQNLLRVKIRR